MKNKFKFHTKIVGSTFVEGAPELISKLKKGDRLFLKAEPENEFDKNAIGVHAPIVIVGNLTKNLSTCQSAVLRVGYIPKDTAAKIQKDIIAGNFECVVSEVTGGVVGRENVGCNIEISITREVGEAQVDLSDDVLPEDTPCSDDHKFYMGDE